MENGGKPQLVDGFSVEHEIEQALQFLARDRDNPFFLYYSISPPHMPLADAPEEYLTMYSPDDVPLRPNVYVDERMAHDEEWFKIYLWDFLYYSQKLPHTLDLPEGFDLRKLTALYYGLTTWVDDMVGRLIAGLRANGLARQYDRHLHLGSWRQSGQSSQVQQGGADRGVDSRASDLPCAAAVGAGRQPITGCPNSRHHADRAGCVRLRGARACSGPQPGADPGG